MFVTGWDPLHVHHRGDGLADLLWALADAHDTSLNSPSGSIAGNDCTQWVEHLAARCTPDHPPDPTSRCHHRPSRPGISAAAPPSIEDIPENGMNQEGTDSSKVALTDGPLPPRVAGMGTEAAEQAWAQAEEAQATTQGAEKIELILGEAVKILLHKKLENPDLILNM